MSNDDFDRRIGKLPKYLIDLLACEPIPVAESKMIPRVPAVYALIENDAPIYVGRTGQKQMLRKRIKNHQSKSESAASFTYKRTCRELGLKAVYKRGSGHTRKERMKNIAFLEVFDAHRHSLRNAAVKFVQIDDPLDQYLFELYATMAMNLDLSGFETH